MIVYKEGFPNPNEKRHIDIAKICNGLPHKVLCDFGCWTGYLKLLTPDKQYVGFDYTAKFPGVVEIDLNLDFPKNLPGKKEDRVCVCSGLLEYIIDLPKFIKNIESSFDTFVFSYKPLENWAKKDIQIYIGNIKTLKSMSDLLQIVFSSFNNVTHSCTTGAKLHEVYVAKNS